MCKPMRRMLLASLLATLAGCGGGSGGSAENDSGLATATPQELAMEDSVHSLINAERSANGVAPLTHDAALRRVARAHSQDMIRRNFFSHTNPDGLSPFDRMTMDFIEYVAAGENIAWNVGYQDPDRRVVDGWMNSAGHRANILNATFTHAGLGVARRTTDGAWYFTQLFSLPAGSMLAVSWVVREESVLDAPDQATSSWTLGPDLG